MKLGTNERVAAAAWLLILALLGLLLVQTLGQAIRTGGNDFSSYMLSAQALWDGEDPYRTASPFRYRYPPFLALILLPLLALPYSAAVVGWFGANVAALFFSVSAAMRPVVSHRSEANPLLLAGLFVLAFPVVQSNLRNGQVNFVVLALTLLSLLAFLRERNIGAALALSAAVAIKLVPLAVLPFFAFRRKFAIIGWTVAFIAALGVLPALIRGGDVLDFYASFATALQSDLSSGSAESVRFAFFSLSRFAAHWLPIGGGLWLDAMGAGVVILGILALEFRCRRGRAQKVDPWAFQLYLLAIPLASPIAESHHLAFAIPPVALVHARLAAPDSSASRTEWIGAGVFWLFWLPALWFQNSTLAFLALAVLFVLVALALLQSAQAPKCPSIG